MTSREDLEQIIDQESSDATDGCVRARLLVVNAKLALDDLDNAELAMRLRQQEEEDELCAI